MGIMTQQQTNISFLVEKKIDYQYYCYYNILPDKCRTAGGDGLPPSRKRSRHY